MSPILIIFISGRSSKISSLGDKLVDMLITDKKVSHNIRIRQKHKIKKYQFKNDFLLISNFYIKQDRLRPVQDRFKTGFKIAVRTRAEIHQPILSQFSALVEFFTVKLPVKN